MYLSVRHHSAEHAHTSPVRLAERIRRWRHQKGVPSFACALNVSSSLKKTNPLLGGSFAALRQLIPPERESAYILAFRSSTLNIAKTAKRNQPLVETNLPCLPGSDEHDPTVTSTATSWQNVRYDALDTSRVVGSTSFQRIFVQQLHFVLPSSRLTQKHARSA